MRIDMQLVEAVLAEMDGIFGSRDRTWEVLLCRFIETTMQGQFAESTLAAIRRNPNELLWLWVKWRRWLRNMPGSDIRYSKEPVSFIAARDEDSTEKENQAFAEYDKQPEKIIDVLGPDKN